MRAGTIAVILTLVFTVPLAAGTLRRNETVYVNLNARGEPAAIEVVTWLKTDGQAPAEDFNRVDNPVNIKGMAEPAVSGDRIRFSSKTKNIFYRGTTRKALPVSLDIGYKLDGKKIKPEDLAGQSGRLRIDIAIKNATAEESRLTYTPLGASSPSTVTHTTMVPFVMMISADFPLLKYSNIKAPAGVKAVVGETVKVKWIVFPWPDQHITFTADVRDIRLPAFMFTAAPKMIPLPEAVHNIQAKLNKVHHGLELLSQYLDRAAQGAQKVAEGNRQVYQHLSQASKEYGRVIKAFDAQTKLISNVMKINQRLQDKIDLVDWAPVIDKMNTALSVENELLGLLLDGGAFSQRTLNFIEAHGGKKPPVDTFPADIARLRKKFEENRSRLAEKKLPRLKKLKEGSRKLADSIQRLQKEGAEKIKRKLAAQSDPLLRKLAALEKAKKTAAAYDRFTGTKPPNRPAPPSAVQFIMKTPGDTVP